MKYLTLALLMAAPCLAQASQYVTGIVSHAAQGRFQVQEVEADLPYCRTIEQIQAHPTACLEGRTIDVYVPTDFGLNVDNLSGSLVRLAGNFEVTSGHGGSNLLFNLLPDGIEVISPSLSQQPEPCYNYNGICH